MKTIKQYKVAEWLGVKPATLANIFCENRRPSRLEAKRLEAISGVSFEDWMLSNGSALRQKVFTAWAVRRGGGEMKEAWERFENSPAAGLVVVVLWCGMLISLMWVAAK